MSSYSSERRALLKIFGAIGSTCAYPFASEELHGQTVPAHTHAPALPISADRPPQFFNKEDFATIARITDLIIPETDTPGAIKAGVPAYIDLVIARNSEQQLVVADGLRWLDGEARGQGGQHFRDLSEAKQLSILEPLCKASDTPSLAPRGRNVQFFALIKSLTADGYYTSHAGLIEELQYKGNTARQTFPECSDRKS